MNSFSGTENGVCDVLLTRTGTAFVLRNRLVLPTDDSAAVNDATATFAVDAELISITAVAAGTADVVDGAALTELPLAAAVLCNRGFLLIGRLL